MKTGIRILDDKLGEIPKNSALLLSASPGVYPTPFGLSILATSLKSKIPGVYLVNNKPIQVLRKEARSLGLNITRYERTGKLNFVDAFSTYMGMPAEEKFIVANPFSGKELALAIRQAGKKIKNPLVVIDSLSSYLDMGGKPDEILNAVGSIKKSSTLLALFSAWEYSPKLIKRIKQKFDCIFTLKALEELTVPRLFLAPEKVGWKKLKRFAVPVRILRPGGIKVYFPKILVTGPYQSGKSSLVGAVSKISVSVDRLGMTVALDHGYLDYKGFAADLYGTPGQEVFDPLLEYIAEDAVGVILVLDSTLPETFGRAKEMLAKTKSYGLPIVVAANKQDLPKALSVREIRALLSLGKGVPICPTIAPARKGTRKVVDELIKKLAG